MTAPVDAKAARRRKQAGCALAFFLALMFLGGLISLGSLDKAADERTAILAEVKALRQEIGEWRKEKRQ